MTVGFIVMFGIFGLLSTSLASTLQRYLPIVTVLVGWRSRSRRCPARGPFLAVAGVALRHGDPWAFLVYGLVVAVLAVAAALASTTVATGVRRILPSVVVHEHRRDQG